MGSARDPGPMARLAAVQADAGSPGVIFQRVCEGERLRDIWRAWGLPKGAATRWFMEEHAGLYDAALRVRADDLAHEALEVAAGASAQDTAPRKLRVDTNLKIAARWDRARYGEQVDVKVTVEPFAALLRRVSERKLAAARGEVVAEQAVPDTLTLMESVQDAGELI